MLTIAAPLHRILPNIVFSSPSLLSRAGEGVESVEPISTISPPKTHQDSFVVPVVLAFQLVAKARSPASLARTLLSLTLDGNFPRTGPIGSTY